MTDGASMGIVIPGNQPATNFFVGWRGVSQSITYLGANPNNNLTPLG
jgi:hypothetical protein